MKTGRFIIVATLLVLFVKLTGCKEISSEPNILLICVDDLRPELGCYGEEHIVSPNIDQLASGGMVFLNHYVQVPTCGASRYTLLTGMLPRKRTELGNEAIRQAISNRSVEENPESFIHHLKRNGYYTVGIGKISHYADGRLYGYNDPVGSELELPHSWDEMLFDAGKWRTGWNAFFAYADGSNRQSKNKMVPPYEAGEVEDSGYPDGLTADLAIRKLHQLQNIGQPFALAVGFFKPHLPFNSPEKYWDLYDEEAIPVSPSPAIPENVNTKSLHPSGEFNQYLLGEEKASLEGPVSDKYARKVKHAYFACISYIDAQIGKILNELEELELDDNTIVVLWGDHGWHLGDHLVWGKHTIFERALKSALIIKAPGITTNTSECRKVVSSIDIYPTILELCGIEMPHATDGKSMIPLLTDPESETWDEKSYGFYKNGITLRTKRYRLTKYYREELPIIELFDHFTDPFENRNIAAEKPDIVDSLLVILEKGNTGVFDN